MIRFISQTFQQLQRLGFFTGGMGLAAKQPEKVIQGLIIFLLGICQQIEKGIGGDKGLVPGVFPLAVQDVQRVQMEGQPVAWNHG